jgi:hypothetical protein
LIILFLNFDHFSTRIESHLFGLGQKHLKQHSYRCLTLGLAWLKNQEYPLTSQLAHLSKEALKSEMFQTAAAPDQQN